MVYPPWESLASASPWPNFPAEDKSHNLCVDVVDPIHGSVNPGCLHQNVYANILSVNPKYELVTWNFKNACYPL